MSMGLPIGLTENTRYCALLIKDNLHENEGPLFVLTIERIVTVNWYEHARNPEAFTSIFSVPPLFPKVRLLGISLSSLTGEATLDIELLEFPDKPSPKWAGKGFTVVQPEI